MYVTSRTVLVWPTIIAWKCFCLALLRHLLVDVRHECPLGRADHNDNARCPRCRRLSVPSWFHRNPITYRAKRSMQRVAEVLYESCWQLAHSSSGRDVCVSHPFFRPFGVRQVPSQVGRRIEFLNWRDKLHVAAQPKVVARDGMLVARHPAVHRLVRRRQRKPPRDVYSGVGKPPACV